MDVSDVASSEYRAVDAETRLGRVRSSLEADDTDGVLVTDPDTDDVSVITARDLLRSHYSDDTTAGRVAKPVPALRRGTGAREAARLLAENRTTVAPVFQNEDLWGSLTRDALLEAVRDRLDVLDVEDVATREVVTVTTDATIGEVVDELREEGVSRLPIDHDDGRLTGIVTTSDVVEVVGGDREAPTSGERRDDKPDLLDLPVTDVSSDPVETTTPDASLATAVGTMLDRGYDGLVVTPEPRGDLVAGVVTKTDVLRALVDDGADAVRVRMTDPDLLERTTREEVAERIEAVVEEDSGVDLVDARVRFQRHEEGRRGRSLVRCVVRVWTDDERLAGTSEEYGADAALDLALDTLERNLLDRKGERSDEEYRGRLLEKLDEL